MELLYAELLHSVPCFSREFATKKYSPQFSVFYSPQHFPEGICLYLSMDWTLLDAAAWIVERRAYRELRRQERESFWTAKVRSEKSCPSELWWSVNELMGRGSSSASSTITAVDFHRFMDDKVAGVRASTDGQHRHSTHLHRWVARCTSSVS